MSLSQTKSPSPPTQAQAPTGAASAYRKALASDPSPAVGDLQRSKPSAWLAGTPGRMRVLLALSLLLALAFGACVAQTFRDANGSLNRAESNTAQLVRVQAIHTSLVSANADATKAFLRGGLEPPALRQRFTDSMASASRLIAEGSKAQPADAEALGALNTTVGTYRGLIEQARSNNRQGIPVGAQYLKDANALVKTDALPVLDALVKANEQRLDQEFEHTGTGRNWVLGFGLLALLGLAGVMVWLAMRTHRYLNIPLLAAVILVALTTIVGAGLLTRASSSADDVRDSSYASTRALAAARIGGYDAQSNESLTLIARGSGASFDKAYTTSAKSTTDRLNDAKRYGIGDAGGPNQWGAYEQDHAKIRKLDTDGNWDGAVAHALGAGSTSFAAFDQASRQSLNQSSTAAQDGLRDAAGGMGLLTWLGIPIGVLVALLAGWGLSKRLEEYR